jgi:hypothetical protein
MRIAPAVALPVEPLAGRAGIAHGHHTPNDVYVDDVWLPVLGPASFIVWRHLALMVDSHGPARHTTLAALAGATGLGSPRGNQSGISRALRRLERFGLVQLSDGRLIVRTRLPYITGRQLARLDPAIQALHRNHRDTHRRAAG